MTVKWLLPGLTMLLCFSPAGGLRAATEGDTTTITVSGTLVDTPNCTINGNNLVEVNFGKDVVISKIDGTSYKRTLINYNLVCTALAKQALMISITGEKASFDSKLLKTSKPGLGIRLMSLGTTIVVGEWLFVTYGSYHPELWAVLVVDSNAPPSAGAFDVFGTMVIAYQ